jgi:hypothetical protein
MRIDVGRLSLQYNKDYGVDHRYGWSIAWVGHFLVDLERFLVVAIWKAARLLVGIGKFRWSKYPTMRF